MSSEKTHSSDFIFLSGKHNRITDITGITVGHAHDPHIASGVTVLLFKEPATASIAIIGGGPANRDTACLEPDTAVSAIDAIVLSGGSGFGLDAASGAQAWLREQNRGLLVGNVKVPIVPQAILFDLLNGGNKEWGRYPPYRELAYEAISHCQQDFSLGSVGAGFGATTVNLKGGIGSASIISPSGFTVAAIAAVNSLSSATMGQGPHFWAAPYEIDNEFGGLGWPPQPSAEFQNLTWKGRSTFATTIAVVATDAFLSKSQTKRLALAAQGGLTKALRLAHGYMDGDTVFSVATNQKPLTDEANHMTELGALASDCLARAIARGVYEASSLPFPESPRSWRETFMP